MNNPGEVASCIGGFTGMVSDARISADLPALFELLFNPAAVGGLPVALRLMRMRPAHLQAFYGKGFIETVLPAAPVTYYIVIPEE